MYKKFTLSIAAAIALSACSDDNSIDSTLENADTVYMNSLLDALESQSTISDNVNLDEAKPTEQPTLKPTSVLISFKTENTPIYEKSTANGSCWVNMYKSENGISYSINKNEKIENSSTIFSNSDDATIVLKEHDGSTYKQDSHFKLPAGNVENCQKDSSKYVSECKENGGLFKVYNKGCVQDGHLEISCVTKVSSLIKIEDIAKELKNNCEEFMDALPKADQQPAEHCQGNSDEGIICETL